MILSASICIQFAPKCPNHIKKAQKSIQYLVHDLASQHFYEICGRSRRKKSAEEVPRKKWAAEEVVCGRSGPRKKWAVEEVSAEEMSCGRSGLQKKCRQKKWAGKEVFAEEMDLSQNKQIK